MMAEHAQRVRAHVLSQPPAAECRLDCWVGVEFGPLHRCEGARWRGCVCGPWQHAADCVG